MARAGFSARLYLGIAVLVVLVQLLTPVAEAVTVLDPAGYAHSGLRHQPGEARQAYLERVARENPERFQAAVLAALQDYFNGAQDESTAPDAFEALVESYLSGSPESGRPQSDKPVARVVPLVAQPIAQPGAQPVAYGAPAPPGTPSQTPIAKPRDARVAPLACLPAPSMTIAGIPGPKGIAVNSDANLIYVASFAANNLVVIDGQTRTILRTVPVPSPNQVAYSSTLNRIYVTNRDAGTLTVLDAASYAVVATVPVESQPFGVAVNPVTHRVYVSNYASNSVSVIDGLTNTVVMRVPLPNLPTFIAVDATRNLAYTLSNWAGTVYVIDASDTAREFAALGDTGPVGIAANPMLNRIYVSSYGGKVYAYNAANAERLAVVDAPGELHALAVNTNGNAVYAAERGGLLHQIDGDNNVYNGSVGVGGGDGDGIAVNTVTNELLVSNYHDNSVSVLLDTCAPAPPTRTPTPTRTATSTHSPTPTASPTRSPTATSTATHTPTPTRTPTASPTPTVSPTGDANTRWIGRIKVRAEHFDDEGGKIRAHGNVILGDFLKLTGAADSLLIDGETFTGSGTAAFGVGGQLLELFSGAFSAVGSSGTLTPGAGIRYLLNQIGGFSTGSSMSMPNISFDGAKIRVMGATDLALKPLGVNSTASIAFSIEAGLDGLRYGGAVTLSGFYIGTGTALKVVHPTATLSSDGSQHRLSLSATLQIRLPQNSQDVKIDFFISTSGQWNLTTTIPKLTFNVGNATLILNGMSLSKEGIGCTNASFAISGSPLANASATLSDVSITGQGFQFGAGAVNIALQPFTLGTGMTVSNVTVNIEVAGNQAYKLSINGALKIDVSGAKGDVAISLGLDSAGKLTGKLTGNLTLSVAGLTVQVRDAQIENATLRAASVTVQMPGGLGGLSITVSNLEVSPSGVKIGGAGGEFSLPDIDAAGFRLTGLRARFLIDNGRIIIGAAGTFTMPNLGATPLCRGIGVGLTIEVTTGSQVLLTVSSPQATARRLVAADASAELDGISGFFLQEATLSISGCKIPIGSTGLDLTGIRGTVSVDPAAGSTTISVGLSVASSLPGMFRADADGTLVTKPFSLAVTGTFWMFSDLLQGDASTRFTSNSFRADIHLSVGIVRGEVSINAWSDRGNFHFTGSGKVAVALAKGSILNVWFLKLPPKDMEFGGIDVAVGEFTNGKWGIRGRVCMQNYCIGAYFDTTGKLTLGNVDQYQLLPPPKLAQARKAWLARERGEALAADTISDPAVRVLSADKIQTDVMVPVTTNLMISLSRTGDLPHLTLIDPGGHVISPTLPATVTFEITGPVTDTVGGPSWTQEIYTIQDAQSGLWRTVQEGEPAPGDEVGLAVLGAIPAPALADVHIYDNGNRTADVSWKLAAVTDTLTLRVVANPGPITSTMVITGAGGVTQTVEQPNYTGIELGVFENPPVDGLPQTRSVSLARLPSGTYYVWFEADDKLSAPVRTYALETISVVQPWVNTWTAKLAAIPGYRSLDVTWDPCPNPDVEGYILTIGPAPGVISQTIDVSATLTTTVGGLTPNQLYYLWLDAVDSETGKKSRSETIGGTPLDAPFEAGLSPASLTVEAGKGTTTTALFSTGVISYPEGISLYLDPLPDGLEFGYTPVIITPTITGTRVSVAITTSETLPGGLYVLPLLAIGGDVTRTMNLSLTVTGPSFEVSASPDMAILHAGESRMLSVAVTGSPGLTKTVSLGLEDAPVGLLNSFDRDELPPGGSTTLTLRDSPLLARGRHVVWLTGGLDLAVQRTPVVVFVDKPGYELATDTRRLAVQAGDSAIYAIDVTATDWTQPIALSLVGAGGIPTGSAGLALTPGGPFADTLKVVAPQRVYLRADTSATTPVGAYPLAIHAVSGGIGRELPLALQVFAPATTADLAMIQQATPEPVLPGETLTFTVKIVNQGPLPAANIVVTDDLPSEVHLVSMSVWMEAGPAGIAAALSVESQPADEIGGGRIVVPIDNLPRGSVATLQIVTRVKLSLSRGWHLINQASASAPQPDHDMTNNASSLAVLVGPLSPATRPRLFMPLILR